MKHIGRELAAGALVFTLACAGTPAAELSYGFDASVGYDDNVTRVPEGEQDETIAAVGAQLRFDQESKRIDASIVGRLEYRDYLDNSFDSEVAGNLVADSRFALVEDRLTWVLADTFGQSTRNQLAADTPANRENINLLTTGPELRLPLGSRNSLLLSGRYMDLYYEDSDLGNERVRGELALQRELSGGSVISLNGNSESVTFDQALFPDFERTEAFLAYDAQAARTQLSASAGVTEISSDANEGFDDWMARVQISRTVSSALTVGLEFGHDISDAGNSFAYQQGQQPATTDPVSVQQTSSPFLNEHLSVFGNFMRNRTGMGARLGYFEETYEALPEFDRKRLALEAHVQRALTPMLSAQARVDYSRNEYTASAREFAELRLTLGASWALGRHSAIHVEYGFFDRTDDVGVVEYSANQLWLRFAYNVGESAGAGPSAGR